MLMKPYRISFYVYAESEEEASSLEKGLYEFVKAKRDKGVAVRAGRMLDALTRFGDNPLVINYFK